MGVIKGIARFSYRFEAHINKILLYYGVILLTVGPNKARDRFPAEYTLNNRLTIRNTFFVGFVIRHFAPAVGETLHIISLAIRGGIEPYGVGLLISHRLIAIDIFGCIIEGEGMVGGVVGDAVATVELTVEAVLHIHITGAEVEGATDSALFHIADKPSCIPLCFMLCLDGLLGIAKVSLIRFLKINAFKNIRTPLHDHFRKNKGWSNTQVIFRFCMIQAILSAVTVIAIK